MYFRPKEYASIDEIKGVSIMGTSNTLQDNREVFGYLPDGVVFADYVFDEISEEWYSVASLPE